MNNTLPTRFEDLRPAELYRSAIEDFALDIEEKDKGKKAVLVAAFAEGGVSWDDYVSQHPEVKPEPVVAVVEEPVLEREPEVSRGNVTTNPAPTNPSALSVDGQVAVEAIPAPVIHTKQEPVYAPQDKVLIKMDRQNPVFETRGYRFTTQRPYHLVAPADANYILRHEDGFRQAYPDELEEFFS